ncbi:TPA: hypothetical protein N0F65_004906 [Lagenidium giganteum]|uniref:Vacuolar fusion protein MON1 homolog n=1 Tax=Lagenidium giganteum TaxID=4803 RepID=A0AAV2YYE8_9STRA|nr:TPA: hypothetical protein N0F65_004906 [Lagenidium giganteum]
MDVLICSTSGKPIYHFSTRASAHVQGDGGSSDGSSSASFTSSIQGLVSFVTCVQQDALELIETAEHTCIFHAEENLTFAMICAKRLLKLLYAQLLFVLSERGLDILRRQPSYDLRELLGGTERVMDALVESWRVEATTRFQHMGVRYLRLPSTLRAEMTRALAYEPEESSSLLCGLLLSRKRVLVIAQPNRKQFSLVAEDLLLLVNFVYNTPSLANSETWTPVCLPHFNATGFLYAYVVFLNEDMCLLLLSSQQSPEQFHVFQAKKRYIASRLADVGAYEAVRRSHDAENQWRPHGDFPLLHHFVFKHESTGECASAATDFPVDAKDPRVQQILLDHYADLYHQMFPRHLQPQNHVLGKRLTMLQDSVAARFIHRPSILVDRLRRDEELITANFFVTSFNAATALSMWP